MTTILTFVQHFTVFKALSLSHIIFSTILPNNFHDLCSRMRKPKLSKSHGAAPRDDPTSQGRGWNLTSGLMTPVC